MAALEIKSDILKILATIENEQLLLAVYDFLKQTQNVGGAQIWDGLTEEQKEEVYLSYQESQDDKTLISWDDVKKKF